MGLFAAGVAKERAPRGARSPAAPPAVASGAARGELVAAVPPAPPPTAVPAPPASPLAPRGSGGGALAPGGAAPPGSAASGRVDLASLAGRATLDGEPLRERSLPGTWLPVLDTAGARNVQVLADGFDARTDAEGRHAVRDLPPGMLAIEVRAPGAALLRLDVDGRAGETLERELAFASRLTLEGRLVVPAGADLVALRLQLVPRETDGDIVTGTALTDRYRFTGVEPGRYRLLAELDGYAGAWADLRVEGGRAAAGPELRIGDGVAVSGRVIAAGGEPMPGQVVEFAPEKGPAFEATTDVWGAFRLLGVPPGPYRLTLFVVEAGSVFAGMSDATRTIEVGAMDLEIGDFRARVDISRIHRATLRGRVVGPDGAPVSGAMVEISSPASGQGVTTASEKDGSFEQAVEAGEVRVSAHLDGLVTPETLSLTAPRDTTVDADLHLIRGGTIRGRVIAPSERLAPGKQGPLFAIVDPESEGFSRQEEIGRDGTFAVRGLARGGHHLTIRAGGAELARRDVEVRAGKETAVEVPLEAAPTGVVHVRVEGVPADLAGHAFVRSGQPGGGCVQGIFEGGEATLEHVAPGPVRVTALFAGGDGRSFWFEREAEVTAERPLVIPFRWPSPAEAGAIEGRLDGLPGAARALIATGDGFGAEVWLDDDATTFRIAPLPPGRHRLVRRERAFRAGPLEGV